MSQKNFRPYDPELQRIAAQANADAKRIKRQRTPSVDEMVEDVLTLLHSPKHARRVGDASRDEP